MVYGEDIESRNEEIRSDYRNKRKELPARNPKVVGASTAQCTHMGTSSSGAAFIGPETHSTKKRPRVTPPLFCIALGWVGEYETTEPVL